MSRSAAILTLAMMTALSDRSMGPMILQPEDFKPSTGPTEADKEKLAKAEAKRQRRAMRNQRNTK